MENTMNKTAFIRTTLTGMGTLCLLYFVAAQPVPQTAAPQEQPTNAQTWQAEGQLLESCTCNVPCPCNFGQPPSHGSCNALFVYRLDHAHYGPIVLDGLSFGGCDGPKSAVGYLDSRATLQQQAALKQLAEAVFAKGGPWSGRRKWIIAPIVTEITPHLFRIQLGDAGGFQAQVLIGRDGKNPIVVENNVTWPVMRFTKGKATQMSYHDTFGNQMQYQNVNANLGHFALEGAVSQRPGH
jgi:hypothetical protein